LLLQLKLQSAIDPELAPNIEKQSAYVSPRLRRLKVSPDRMSVELEIDDERVVDEVREKVLRFLEAMTTQFRAFGNNVVFKNTRRDRGALETNVYAQLKERGWVLELGHGQVGFAGPALALARAIDDAASTLGKKHFGAAEHSYPALIPVEVLSRCGYFSSFPQACSIVTRLVEDYDRIEAFRSANNNKDGTLTITSPDLLIPGACLTPAVCYHCYQSLEGKTIADPGMVVTTVGKVFRYESRNMTGLDRLWDFTQRDIIFLGMESFVMKQRQEVFECLKGMVTDWDIECQIETASDPFFPAVAAAKTFWQRSLDLKYEVQVTVEPGPAGAPRSIACSSVNLHGNFFGSTFNFKAAGEPSFTCCVGWGIERWVLAGFTQHGLTPTRWPDSLRSAVFS
jgi:seryl-tRNA synthetase